MILPVHRHLGVRVLGRAAHDDEVDVLFLGHRADLLDPRFHLLRRRLRQQLLLAPIALHPGGCSGGGLGFSPKADLVCMRFGTSLTCPEHVFIPDISKF